MSEKEQIYSSYIKHTGNFDFKDFYQFCFDWITEQIGMGNLSELEYNEKVNGDAKDLDILWEGSIKLSDYFKFNMKVAFKVLGMKKVEVEQAGVKKSMNNGLLKMTVKGTLVRDYDGKFESGALLKFMRSIYEKWVIPSRVDQMEDKVTESCDEFISQSKAFLDLEGRK